MGMLVRYREFMAYSAALLVGILLVAPLLHAGIPHLHGETLSPTSAHTHGESEHRGEGGANESVIWQSLHAALRHEDKKMLGDIVFGAVVLAFCVSVYREPRTPTWKRRVIGFVRRLDHNSGALLSRGVHRYRVFG